MNLEEYRIVFATGSLALMLIMATPTLSLIVPFPEEREPFSEFWVLGPNHMAEDDPVVVRGGGEYSVFAGIGNHMGGTTYCAIYVKFRNQTEPLPSVSGMVPSPLPPLYEFQVFIADGSTWESPVNFTIVDAFRQDNSTIVQYLSINGFVFETNSMAIWDSESRGFFYQLFFELWIYDTVMNSFRYHNRFVGVWLKITR